MPAAKKATTTKSSGPDAVELLTADHSEVKAMFKEFEAMKKGDADGAAKAALVQKICTALTIHATIEEEIFYPALREAINDIDLMDEADVEHASAKDLIAQLESASPGDDHYDAKVTVLGEMIDHHVKEEEGEMFPKAKKAIDTANLGAELEARQAELKDELGANEDPVPPPKRGAADRRNSARK